MVIRLLRGDHAAFVVQDGDDAPVVGARQLEKISAASSSNLKTEASTPSTAPSLAVTR